ncbi:hypothetical protein B0T25DRAFT_550202 [Lasiosphaeria hispida]|uniref:Secreted protein n=1 Tax=Lasiosphaeria hispida TaxID=260671 RepID=A0AAJ0HGB3_9PEZI|nr:hypothetical protein B0T25DRAFT_550202 [Lasiosphaeria hispida]
MCCLALTRWIGGLGSSFSTALSACLGQLQLHKCRLVAILAGNDQPCNLLDVKDRTFGLRAVQTVADGAYVDLHM